MAAGRPHTHRKVRSDGWHAGYNYIPIVEPVSAKAAARNGQRRVHIVDRQLFRDTNHDDGHGRARGVDRPPDDKVRGANSGATIHAEVKPLQTSGSLSTYTLSGAIPDGTVTAVLGIRVNRECPRQGDCDIRVTDVHVETDTAQPCVMAFAQPSDLDNWSQLPSQQPGQNVALEDGTLHIQMDAAHGMILNSKPLPIPLTGNARLVVRATIPTSSVGTGAFILVFLAPKKEITRQSIPFDVPATELPDASTDKNGRWAQPLPSGQVQVHGQFDGDTTYWPADVSVIGK